MALTTRLQDVVKAPFRQLKIACLAVTALAVIALGISLVWPPFWTWGVTVGLAWLIIAVLLHLLLFTRLYAKITDLQASVSLYSNLPADRAFKGGLFVDGASANASFLLFLWKCLEVCRPKAILELGSGQTTKLLAHYFHNSPGTTVCTLEHDEAWVKALTPLITRDAKHHDYWHAPLVDREFECPGTRTKIRTKAYTFPQECETQLFDLVLVDGPDAGPGSQHTREGVLEFVPKVLAKNFVLIFDDTERRGERRLADTCRQVLGSLQIPFIQFDIEAVKTQTVFCSPGFAFLRSM